MELYGRAPARDGSQSDPSVEWSPVRAVSGLEGGLICFAFEFHFVFIWPSCVVRRSFWLGFVRMRRFDWGFSLIFCSVI